MNLNLVRGALVLAVLSSPPAAQAQIRSDPREQPHQPEAVGRDLGPSGSGAKPPSVPRFEDKQKREQEDPFDRFRVPPPIPIHGRTWPDDTTPGFPAPSVHTPPPQFTPPKVTIPEFKPPSAPKPALPEPPSFLARAGRWLAAIGTGLAATFGALFGRRKKT